METFIAREQWPEYCQRFTGQYAGGLVTVVAHWPDNKEEVLARTLRLIILTAQVPEQGDGGFADLGGQQVHQARDEQGHPARCGLRRRGRGR